MLDSIEFKADMTVVSQSKWEGGLDPALDPVSDPALDPVSDPALERLAVSALDLVSAVVWEVARLALGSAAVSVAVLERN
eukprot:scaffold3515_cov126-Cylindrotheca_fusiformis.AAC.23